MSALGFRQEASSHSKFSRAYMYLSYSYIAIKQQ